MKKKTLLLASILAIATLTSCSIDIGEYTPTFSNDNYTLKSGDYIKVDKERRDTTYHIIGNSPQGVNLALDGKFTFDSSIPNYQQVLVIAKYKEKVSNEVVVTLIYDYLSSSIVFTNPIDYVMDGEFITAIDSNNYGITYEINPSVKGISINSSSGKVQYTDIVEDGTHFTVVAKSGTNNIASHEFVTVTKNVVKVHNSIEINELISPKDNIYYLNFDEYPSISNDDIVCLTDEYNSIINTKYYSYNKSEKSLTIKAEYIPTLTSGEKKIKCTTKRNSIDLSLNIADRFVDSVEDLLYIRTSPDTLKGYYIQTKDIDLKEYLANEGYNEGKGWNPIGIYHDVIGEEATKDAFKGTYDGNGHKITSLTANRKDELAFNFGLFGYCTSSSVIKNLGVEGRVSCSSYSGGLVGSNSGIISNCYSNVVISAYSGGKSYRYLGGLVGNNFGKISTSYSVGNVMSDKEFGAFVGYNEGVIENCFARESTNCKKFVGYGVVSNTNILFASLDEMKSYDYSEVFTSKYWNLQEGQLPSLVPNAY